MNEDTAKAVKLFHAAAKKVARQILQVAEGDKDMESKAIESLDALEHRIAKPEIRGDDAARETCWGAARELRKGLVEAREMGYQARQAGRNAEIARLNEAENERRRNMSWEERAMKEGQAELEQSRLRRGR